MPDAFEFPGVLRAVVPHVGCEGLPCFRRDVIRELVALAFRHSVRRRSRLARRESWLDPRLPAVIRALNDLPEPRARLRRIDSIRICRRSLEVIHLPPRKMRPADLPVLPFSIRGQDKSSFARAHQNSYSAHGFSFVIVLVLLLVIESYFFAAFSSSRFFS